jgi:hypothetical protein
MAEKASALDDKSDSNNGVFVEFFTNEGMMRQNFDESRI